MVDERKGYVFAYINPDTDGVCSSIAYSYLMHTTVCEEYAPVMFGTQNSETVFVLKRFGVDPPTKVSEIAPNSPIVILDTHHKNQLPPTIPFENVVEVIDHHPQGDVDAFPKARIQNEEVGAVATLIAERVKSASLNPDMKIAGILAAATISNTINFCAPSTSERDKAAFKWLHNYVRIDDEFINAMFRARSSILDRDTEEVLTSDYKEFTIGNRKIGISQLEATDVASLNERRDLLSCLKRLRSLLGLDDLVFNGIDVLRRESIIVAVEPDTRILLEMALGVKFEDAIVVIPRILLRKTDIVPRLKLLLKES